MGGYPQPCSCRSRAVAAERDERRYQRQLDKARSTLASCHAELQSLVATEARLTDQIRDLMDDVRHLRRSIPELEGKIGRARETITAIVVACFICGGTGVVQGNGCAQVGGSGRTRGFGLAA